MTITARLDIHPTAASKEEIYANAVCRRILQSMVGSLKTVIAPQILLNDEITYPQVEAFVGGRVDNAENLLSNMAEAGVLVAELVDKAPRCPECGSQQLSTRYTCPRCFGFDIARNYLYEHLKCGKVASDDTFKKGERLVCPKCQMVLHDFGVEYRAVGAWYKCNGCAESFNLPTHSHFCRQNRHQFTMDRARLVPVYQYRLNQSLLSEVRRNVLLYAEAITILENFGLKVLAPHSLLGKSGEQQPFDLVIVGEGGWRKPKTIAIDAVISENALGADAVRAFASKVKDARPSDGYLVVVPKLTDEARKLAKNLKLSVVEGATLNQAISSLHGRGIFKKLIP